MPALAHLGHMEYRITNRPKSTALLPNFAGFPPPRAGQLSCSTHNRPVGHDPPDVNEIILGASTRFTSDAGRRVERYVDDPAAPAAPCQPVPRPAAHAPLSPLDRRRGSARPAPPDTVTAGQLPPPPQPPDLRDVYWRYYGSDLAIDAAGNVLFGQTTHVSRFADGQPRVGIGSDGVVHVDGTARVQTVDAGTEPLMARVLREFDRRTGVPVVVNTSLNTAGRPMVDDPRDALECFGSAPVDLLAIGRFVVRRPR